MRHGPGSIQAYELVRGEGVWCEKVLAARVEEQSSFGDKGGYPPLSPAGKAAEALPGGQPLKAGVEYVRAVVDFGCLSEGLLAKNACTSSDRPTDGFKAH